MVKNNLNINLENPNVFAFSRNIEKVMDKLKLLLEENPDADITLFSNCTCQTTIGEQVYTDIFKYGTVVKINNNLMLIEDINPIFVANKSDDSIDFSEYISEFLKSNKIEYIEVLSQQEAEETLDFFDFEKMRRVGIEPRKPRKPGFLTANSLDDIIAYLTETKEEGIKDCAYCASLPSSINIGCIVNDNNKSKEHSIYSYQSNNLIYTNSNIIFLSPSVTNSIKEIEKLIKDHDFNFVLRDLSDRNISSPKDFANKALCQDLINEAMKNIRAVENISYRNPLEENISLDGKDSISYRRTTEPTTEEEEAIKEERRNKEAYRAGQKAQAQIDKSILLKGLSKKPFDENKDDNDFSIE